MFEKGAMVYYGTAGVCRVDDICKSPFDKNDERMYYVLAPDNFDNGTIIYAPAEGGKVMLRALMTAGEADELLGALAALAPIEVVNEKHRREEYRNALKDGTPLSMGKIIKTIYVRKKNAVKMQKRMSDTDAEFDKIARRSLAGELAYVLNVTAAYSESMINTAMKS